MNVCGNKHKYYGNLEWLFGRHAMSIILTLCSYLATDGVDFTGINFPVTFTQANQAGLQCTDITVNDDLICEDDETIPVSLTTAEDPSEVQLSPSAATVTIIDNDGMPLSHFSYSQKLIATAWVLSL